MAKGKLIWPSAAALLAGVGTAYIVNNPEKREKIMNTAKRQWTKISPLNRRRNKASLKQRIGHPDPNDFGDNNMVAEGSTYSVHYYNQRQAYDNPNPLDIEENARHH